MDLFVDIFGKIAFLIVGKYQNLIFQISLINLC